MKQMWASAVIVVLFACTAALAAQDSSTQRGTAAPKATTHRTTSRATTPQKTDGHGDRLPAGQRKQPGELDAGAPGAGDQVPDVYAGRLQRGLLYSAGDGSL